ncbi:MAG: FkbM family methyltransferase [Dongiaceae bacterium]
MPPMPLRGRELSPPAEKEASAKVALSLHRSGPCRHGFMFWLKRDAVIGRALQLYGEFAESENRLMARFLRAGDMALDVGANIGTCTLAMARAVGPNGLVHAFEPQALVFQTLCANLAINGLTQVRAWPWAVGEEAGTARIPVPALDTDENFGAVQVQTTGHTEAVPLVRLDDIGIERAALLKIDVEGMELAVLRGAAALLQRCRPVVYFEAKKGFDDTVECLKLLRNRQYRMWWHFARFYDTGNMRGNRENVFPNQGDINALAVPVERVPARFSQLPQIDDPEADWENDYRRFHAAVGKA